MAPVGQYGEGQLNRLALVGSDGQLDAFGPRRHLSQVNDREGRGGYRDRAEDRRNRPRHAFARAPLRGNWRRQTDSAAALRDPRQLDLGVVSRLVTRVRIFRQARA